MRSFAIFIKDLAIATTVLGYFQVSFWLMPGERQTATIRKKLFNSILRQEIGWFDTYKSGELSNRLTE
jgi:ATP-binding cassette subfamily B (MDR/TAP) protein 1